MAGKGAPPLFDLIRSDVKTTPPAHAPSRGPEPARDASDTRQQAPEQRPAAPTAAPAPEPKPKRKLTLGAARRPASREPEAQAAPEAEAPAPAPATSEPPPPDTDPPERSENDGAAPQFNARKKFSVPAAALYICVPLVLLGGLFAYSWGFNAGGKNRDDELKPFLQTEDVIDPLVAGAEQSRPPPPGAGSESAARQASQPRVERPAASPVTRDTRQPGMNYLLIARADGERAIKAAMALTERGLPTIAVESGSGRSNNAWRLYSLLGISSEKFKEEWQLRADHKAKIVAACRDLKADAGGPIDASTAYWEKYAP